MIQVTRDSAGNIRGRTYTATLVDYKNRVYNVISASTLNGGPWGAKGIEPQTVMHLRRKPGVVGLLPGSGLVATTTSVNWLPPTKRNQAQIKMGAFYP